MTAQNDNIDPFFVNERRKLLYVIQAIVPKINQREEDKLLFHIQNLEKIHNAALASVKAGPEREKVALELYHEFQSETIPDENMNIDFEDWLQSRIDKAKGEG